MKPSSYSTGLKQARTFSPELFQSWLKGEARPEGTIPILRTQDVHKPPRVIPPILQTTQLNKRNAFVHRKNDNHEYARVSIHQVANYYGAHALFNVWTPRVHDEREFDEREFSLSQVVHLWFQVRHLDHEARLFIYWTRDGYHRTGCYNLECPGFVQTNNRFVIGGPIRPTSVYGGNHKSGNWWLRVQEQDIGYWPGSIFTSLAKKATLINSGGEKQRARIHHTPTQMGSGHFAEEGFGKACFMGQLGYFDNANMFRNPQNLTPTVTNPSCYDLVVGKGGKSFFFGGHGFSQKCS
ncbi:hypothetical protein K2173_024312 [Erythroxylum novogranatense]|uniref:Neprosin PEP catalytic domain-containing protein n=1 Tax=Erythroxylum novogranatense TaxID=1862640 RepID=A0AAV8SUP3_9ROSI|nr:hypothetical protein K2173_024312 [Erythroxylum novogranatense]